MRSLHVIMPMAGEGSRFVNEGWTVPKPLIEVNGKPLFLRAIESLPKDIEIKYSFIVRQNHIESHHIDERIKYHLPDANIFSVSKTTRGAVETCLVAESVIDSLGISSTSSSDLPNNIAWYNSPSLHALPNIKPSEYFLNKLFNIRGFL